MDINQNLGNLMKEAQKMQQRMQEAQQQLSQLIVTGESGGGMVKIEMNGRHDVTKVKISKTLVEEIEMLEDLIAAAVNDAVRKVENVSKSKINELTAGLNLPKDFMNIENKAGNEE
jgi:DNA-binding YbaB/EbfC family protein